MHDDNKERKYLLYTSSCFPILLDHTLLNKEFKSWGCDLAISPICLAAVNLVAWVDPALVLLRKDNASFPEI